MVPRLSSNPSQTDTSIGADFYGCGFGSSDCFLNALHQILGVSNQHVGRLLIFFGAWKNTKVRQYGVNNYFLQAKSPNSNFHKFLLVRIKILPKKKKKKSASDHKYQQLAIKGYWRDEKWNVDCCHEGLQPSGYRNFVFFYV